MVWGMDLSIWNPGRNPAVITGKWVHAQHGAVSLQVEVFVLAHRATRRQPPGYTVQSPIWKPGREASLYLVHNLGNLVCCYIFLAYFWRGMFSIYMCEICHKYEEKLITSPEWPWCCRNSRPAVAKVKLKLKLDSLYRFIVLRYL